MALVTRARAFRSAWQWERSCGVGRWPYAGAGGGGASLRCIRAWLPGGLRGQRYCGPYGLALLAEAYATGDRPRKGCSVLAEALALVDDNGERCWEAELYRLKGELLLQHAVAAATERRKPAFSRPSPWPATSKPNPGSCGRP